MLVLLEDSSFSDCRVEPGLQRMQDALRCGATSEISVVDFAYVERRCKRPMRQSRVNVLRAGLSGL